MTPDLNSVHHLHARIRNTRSRLLEILGTTPMATTPPARVAALNDLDSWLHRFPRHESFLHPETQELETYGFTEADRIIANAESSMAD